MNKIEKKADFGCRPEKLASNLRINITEMGKCSSPKNLL